MKNINQLMKQAQEMQAKMGKLQKDLEARDFSGSSGAGSVQVVINGKGEMRSIKIDPSLVNPQDVEILEDLIIAAFQDAKNKMESAIQKEMGGFSLPEGLKLPF